MTDAQIEALIHLYDNTIRLRQKLLGYNFAEEVLSKVPNCLKNHRALKAHFAEKTAECEHLKKCLGIAQEKVAKLYSRLDNLIDSQVVEKNIYAEEFCEFAIFLENRSKSRDKNDGTLNSESGDWLQPYEELLKTHFAKKLDHDLEALKLDFKKMSAKCEHLKTCLNAANEDISALSSSLSVVKNERDDLNYLSEKLCILMLKYQQRYFPIGETRKTEVATLRDYSINGNNQIEINSEIEYDDYWPVLPPPEFRDDPMISPDEVFPKEMEYHYSAALVEEATNFQNGIGDVFHFEHDHPYAFIIEESCDAKSSIDNTAVKNKPVEAQGISVADSSAFIMGIRERLGLFKEPASSQIINNGIRKPIPGIDGNKSEAIVATLETKKSAESVDIENTPSNNQSQVSKPRCDICGRYFAHKASLKRHLRNIHKREKPYKCTARSKPFADSNALKTRTFSQESRKLFECSSCNKLFKDLNGKHFHEQKVHGDARYQCAHCDVRYTTKDRLRYHIHTRHFYESLKKFKCAVCDKSFILKINLNAHQLMHSRDKGVQNVPRNENEKTPRMEGS